MVAPTGTGSLVILQANGEKIELPEDQIEFNSRSKVSAMPDGLLNKLTLEQVADLFAYLGKAPSDETNLSRRPAKISPE